MTDNIDPLLRIAIAADACDERRYEDAARILSDIPIVLVRTRDAGVHFGKLAFIASAQHGTYRVALKDCRRIWNWTGANTLNEIALHGIKGGRVSEPLPVNHIPQVIEVIPCSDKAVTSLQRTKWNS